MNSERTSILSNSLGTRRRCADINRYEIIFFIVAILGTIVTDCLTIASLVQVSQRDEDFAYAILILVNSAFLVIFLVTGLLFQRMTDIMAFLISTLMLTIYVIMQFIARGKEADGTNGEDTKLLIGRLIFTIIFNIIIFPLSVMASPDYLRDKFSIRLFTFSEARRRLTTYNKFDCIARINTMFSISLFMLNLYNFNQLEAADTVLLVIGIPWTLLWLGIGIGMVRIESYTLVRVFCLISLFQPGFIIYCLISGIKYSPISTTTTSPFTTTISSKSPFITITSLTSLSKSLIPIVQGLYVCIAVNVLTHIFSQRQNKVKCCISFLHHLLHYFEKIKYITRCSVKNSTIYRRLLIL